MNLVSQVCMLVSSLYFINADVPVFTWSNKIDLSLPQVFAGHSKSQEEFRKQYLDLAPSNILVFVQKELSISDILINGGVYGSSEGSSYEQLKAMMEEYISAYMPAVEKPLESILRKADEEEFVLKKLTEAGVEDGVLQGQLASMEPGKKFLVVVDFTEFVAADQKRIDSLVGSIVKYFRDSKQHFHAFYTAKHDNQADMELVVGGASENSRHLLAADTASEPPVVNGDFVLWFDNLTINSDLVTNSINLAAVSVLENTCSRFNASSVPPAANCSVLLSMGSLSPLDDIKLRLAVVTSGKANQGFWYIREVLMTYNNGSLKDQTSVMVGGLTDPTPLFFSYSCNEAPVMVSRTSINGTVVPSVKLFFHGLQIEPFASNPPNFGYYNDCVGFFTTAIWMFLITAFVLVIILFFGLIMLMGINTMDRYDDPKGKTITVSNTD